MCKIPLVQVAAELYLLVYELGPVTMVQLAAYQAASLGVVDPAMHDTVFAEYFQIVARDTIGMEALDIAYRRMFPFKMAGLLPPYRPRKRNIALKESKQNLTAGAPGAIACTGLTKANRLTGRRRGKGWNRGVKTLGCCHQLTVSWGGTRMIKGFEKWYRDVKDEDIFVPDLGLAENASSAAAVENGTDLCHAHEHGL